MSAEQPAKGKATAPKPTPKPTPRDPILADLIWLQESRTRRLGLKHRES